MKSKKSKQDTSANVKSNFGAQLLKINTKSSLLAITHNATLVQSIDNLNESANRGFSKISGLLINQLKLAAATRADSKDQFQDMLRKMKEDKLEKGTEVVPAQSDPNDKKDKKDLSGLYAAMAIIAAANSDVIGKIGKYAKSIFLLTGGVTKLAGAVKKSRKQRRNDKTTKTTKTTTKTNPKKTIKGKIAAATRKTLGLDPKVEKPKPFRGMNLGPGSEKVKKPKPTGKIMKVVKGITSGKGLLGGAARLVGKLFYPITILMGVVDAVTGAIEGFKKDGILGGIVGAITGVIDGLIAKPLDLLKDIVSWIAEKMGFKKVSKDLDSFTFSGIMDGVYDSIMEQLKNIIKTLLPKQGSWLSKFVPDSLYEWAGDGEAEDESVDKPVDPPVTKTSRKVRREDKVENVKEKEKDESSWFGGWFSDDEKSKETSVAAANRGRGAKKQQQQQKDEHEQPKKPNIEDSVTTGTKANQSDKQAADNAKTHTNIVDASSVQNNKSSSQTINNLATESPRIITNRLSFGY